MAGEGEEKIKVGDKEYTPEELQSAIQKSESAKGLEERLQGYSKVDEFTAKFGTDVEGLLENADGAFTLVSKLIDEGIIDSTGKVIVKKEPVKGKVPGDTPPPPEGDDLLSALLKGDSKGLKGAEKLEAIVAKAIEPHLVKLGKQVEEVVGVQTGILRQQWQEKIQGKYPDLDDDDVARVFRMASENSKLTLWDCAEKVNSKKSEVLGGLRKKHAQEFGINLEEFDQNKLKEAQGGEGGGAAVMFQGKKFSLSKRRADKDTVDPRDATIAYLKKQGVIR
jgi:hypothetical protein